MRDRSWRRFKEVVKQSKRLDVVKRMFEDRTISDKTLGYIKNNHLGCGCGMCKPYKHGSEGKYQTKKKSLAEHEMKMQVLESEYAEV